eukprot:m.44817 g.44817  ORF g.44817 m.44817 type:complete len:273 (+) comp7189_c1_seq2:49-867(+)
MFRFDWLSRFVPAAWWSKDDSVRWYEKFAVNYFPVWSMSIASVVAFKFYEKFSGTSYFIFGLCCALPTILIPLVASPRKYKQPFFDQFWVKALVWDAVFTFIGNHFLTYYFFNMLGCRYTIPGGWALNGIPLVMHFLTLCYFQAYHTFASMILRRFNFDSMSMFKKCMVVFGMGYSTAVMEAVSISAFPHYYYPDRYAMYVFGSAFYSLMFLITYPAYYDLVEKSKKEKWTYFFMHSLACGMAVFIADDVWRLIIGPVVEINSTTAVPYAQL